MIPSKISQTFLTRAATPGEVLAVVIAVAGSGLGTFVVQGRSSKAFAFQFDKTRGAHVLRFPASLWTDKKAGLAKELFDHNLSLPMIPTVEAWERGRSIAELLLPELPPQPVEELPAKPDTDPSPAGLGLAIIPHTAEELAEAREIGIAAFATGDTLSPFGDEMPELTAAWTAGYESAKKAAEPEPEPEPEPSLDTPEPAAGAFTMAGDDIMLGDERVGGLFDPGGHLRMSPGKKDLRRAVEAFLASAKSDSPE